MLEVRRRTLIAIMRDRGPREIKSAPVCVGHYLYRVWIRNVFCATRRSQRAYLHRRIRHHVEQGSNMFGTSQRLVALHVEINVCRGEIRDLVDALGSAPMLR